MLLHLDPDAVRLRDAEPGATAPMADLWPRVRVGGVAAVSTNGVLGDPAGATAAEGARIVSALREDLRAAVSAWRPDHHGRIGAPGGSGSGDGARE